MSGGTESRIENNFPLIRSGSDLFIALAKMLPQVVFESPDIHLFLMRSWAEEEESLSHLKNLLIECLVAVPLPHFMISEIPIEEILLRVRILHSPYGDTEKARGISPLSPKLPYIEALWREGKIWKLRVERLENIPTNRLEVEAGLLMRGLSILNNPSAWLSNGDAQVRAWGAKKSFIDTVERVAAEMGREQSGAETLKKLKRAPLIDRVNKFRNADPINRSETYREESYAYLSPDEWLRIEEIYRQAWQSV